MSSDEVDHFHIRFRDEVKRLGALGISMADLAAKAGLKNSQAIRDTSAGRKRLTAELLAKLAEVGVDANYVLTGAREAEHQQFGVAEMAAAYSINPDEAALLDNYRHSPPDAQAILRATGAACAQQKTETVKPKKGRK